MCHKRGREGVNEMEMESESLIPTRMEVLEALVALMDQEGGEPGSYGDPERDAEASKVWEHAFDVVERLSTCPECERPAMHNCHSCSAGL